MAETKVGVKLGVTGDKKVESAFKAVGKSAESFDKKAGSLSGTLKKLAGAAVGLFAFRQVAKFMGEATKAAGIQEKMEARLASSLRTSVGATKDQIKGLVEYAGALQKTTSYADEQIISGMGILSTFQLTSEQIKEASDRMVDMAAGTERATGEQQDLSTIAMALGRALTMGAGALTRYGVVMSDAEKAAIGLATGNEKLMLILEALDKNYKGIAEAMATTYSGQLKIFENAWGDLKEEIGFGVLPVLSETIKAMTETSNTMETGASIGLVLFDVMSLLSKVLVGTPKLWNKINLSVENWFLKAERNIELMKDWGLKSKETVKYVADLDRAIDRNKDEIEAINVDYGEFKLRLKEAREGIVDGTRSWEYSIDALKGGIPILDEAGDAVATMAKKIESAFGSLSKTITSQIETQISSIRKLEGELAGLSEDTDKQLGEAEGRYNDNLKAMARMAQERVSQVNKQIKDISSARGRGWRGEIEELEAEKKKQNAIIKRIGGEVVDIRAEAKKDELVVLQEAHAKEIAEIKNQAKKQGLELQKEILEEKIGLTRGAVEVGQPGFFQTAIPQEVGLRAWEQSPNQNIFNFNFEGEVSDRDALIRYVTDSINRAAELKQYGGE